ncbi:MAG: pilus assembly protein [Chloroflexota bacterium]|nr:pilus assembly protein [Chloroflexota bacterium]
MSRRFIGRQRTRGQAMVEFALVVPLFVLLLVGLFDVGRAVFAFHTVNNAAREAARLAIVDQTVAHIQDEAVLAASGLGLQVTDIDVSFEDNDGNPCTVVGSDDVYLCHAIVVVTYPYSASTPLIGNLIGQIDLVGESSFPVATNCREPEKPQCPLGS